MAVKFGYLTVFMVSPERRPHVISSMTSAPSSSMRSVSAMAASLESSQSDWVRGKPGICDWSWSTITSQD